MTSHQWGRVADDGTVFVRTADGERSVGQYPEGTPEEALKFFTERFDALAFEVGLLEQRVRAGVLSPEEATSSVTTVREQVTDANAVGDLVSLAGRLDALGPVHRRAARGPQGRARAEAAESRVEKEKHRRRGRAARREQRLAQRRQPAARAARRVEGAPPARPSRRRRAVAPLLDRADGVHPAPQGALRRAARAREGARAVKERLVVRGRGARRLHRLGPDRRRATAT